MNMRRLYNVSLSFASIAVILGTLLCLAFTAGCATTGMQRIVENDWQSVQNANTIAAYENFVRNHSRSPYTASAYQRLAVLYENDAWMKAGAADTIAAYENFLKTYPRSSYAATANQKLAELKETDLWNTAVASNSITAFEEYLMKYPGSSRTSTARDKLRLLYNLSKRELENIEQQPAQAEASDTTSRLVMAGANCLDDNASWTDIEQGRKIYNILKKAMVSSVTYSLQRVVVTTINRKRVLFLAVKLGIPGSEEALNGLLMEYGDKSMAEDYLNSGSKELYDGGAAWARAHGYSIGTGWGSSRIGWGRF